MITLSKGGSISVTLEGLEPLIRAMDTFPANMAKATFRDSLNYAMTPLISEMKKRVVVDSGSLKKAIAKRTVVRITTKRQRAFSQGFARSSKNHPGGYHAHLVELGFDHKSGKRVKARRYMNPAFEAVKDDMFQRLKMKLTELIAKNTDKLGWFR